MDEIKTKVEESIFHSKIIADDFVPIQSSPTEALNRVIEHRRSSLYDELAVIVSIDDHPSIKSSQSPILFEEKYLIDDAFDTPTDGNSSDNSIKRVYKLFSSKLHLFVLVHGFGGNQSDMLNMMNHLSFWHSNAEFLLSNANSSENSRKDIDILANNLIKEIETDVEYYGIQNIDKISFIGFSLGGIIIRAALPQLAKYKDKFHSYISLATPHLGLKLKPKVVAAGLWFMNKLYNNKCLEQLNFEDDSDIEQTFMYKLSRSTGLSWFKNITFFASSQDTYWSFGSARVQVFKEQILDGNYWPEILQMAENILLKLSTKSITRVNANFYLNDSYLETMLSEDERPNYNT